MLQIFDFLYFDNIQFVLWHCFQILWNYICVDHDSTTFNAFTKRYVWNVWMDKFCNSVFKVNDIYIIREVRVLHLPGIITDADINDTIYQQVIETEKTPNESQSLIPPPKNWNVRLFSLFFFFLIVLKEFLHVHVHNTHILKMVVLNLQPAGKVVFVSIYCYYNDCLIM